MSRTNWSEYGTKRLDFNFFSGGGGKTEYLIAGVLAVIILGAGIMIYKSVWGTSQTQKGPSEIHYKCGDPNCGNEFIVQAKDLPKAQHYADEKDVMKLKCPKCGAEHVAWQERECPNCHKFFIGDSTIALYNSLSAGRPGEPTNVRDICPHCQTDVNQWWIDHNPNKKK